MYYPKSQIKTNLYTNGKDYILSTTKELYTGYYYEISTGQLYTGKTPNNKPNILLLSSTPTELSLPFITSSPNSLITLNNPDDTNPYYPTYDLNYVKITPSRFIPSFNPTYPTDQQIQQGEYTRYFCKKNNELIYIEIDNPTYQLLKNKSSTIAWDLYTPTTISWKIGNFEIQSYPQNQSAVLSIERNLKWYGFSQYFKGNFN